MQLGILLTLHFIADFMLQKDYIAINKSKSIIILLIHTIHYSVFVTLSFLLISFIFKFGWTLNDIFLIFAWLLLTHTVIDAITSRAAADMYPVSRHWFFVIIGFDQLLHNFTLLAITQLY